MTRYDYRLQDVKILGIDGYRAHEKSYVVFDRLENGGGDDGFIAVFFDNVRCEQFLEWMNNGDRDRRHQGVNALRRGQG